MEDKAKLGMNRTGIQMSPFDGPAQAEYASSRPAHPSEMDMQAAGLRASYIQESERIGSVPVPTTTKGVATAAKGKLTGNDPEVLFDKLGQRLAFERSGVRLYQAMIGKVGTVQPANADALLADLNHICNEEYEHFQMLTQVVDKLGGDPTAQTPCADVSAVSNLGILQVITNPRTTIAQSLESLLTVEMTDNASWELLIQLASRTGHQELDAPFQSALASEKEHVSKITSWLQTSVLGEKVT